MLEIIEELERRLLIIWENATHISKNDPKTFDVSMTSLPVGLASSMTEYLDNLDSFVHHRQFDIPDNIRTVDRIIASKELANSARTYIQHSSISGELSFINLATDKHRSIDNSFNDLREQIATWLDATPLDLRSVNLSDIQMSVEDVAGATWDSETIWPSEDFAVQVRRESDEISPNVYRVRLGTEQHSFTF